jgi:hypothetical protein
MTLVDSGGVLVVRPRTADLVGEAITLLLDRELARR